jgi:hypothetical protein
VIGTPGESVKEIQRIEAPSEFHLFWIAALAFGALLWLLLG